MAADGGTDPVGRLRAVTTVVGRLLAAVPAPPATAGAARAASRAGARQQAAVAAIGQSALSAGPMTAVLDDAARTAARTLGVPAVVLFRATPAASDEGDWVLTPAAAAAGDGADPDPALVAALAGCPAGRAMSARSPVVEPAAAEAVAAGARTVAAVVVGTVADPWGVLVAASPEEAAFTVDDLAFLRSVAHIVAAAEGRRRAEAEVRHRAAHDTLTGLPNRERLVERLHDQLHRARADRGSTALLLLDLDGFKDVNDSQGHQAGDHVLRQVADRLRVAIGPRGVVARLGGDEFAVVLGELRSVLQARVCAEEVVALLRESPFGSPGGPVRIGGSVGIAVAPGHGNDPQTLLMHADLAMYRAKRERLGCAVFDARRDQRASTRLALVTELRTAIAEGDVRVEFQPLVRLDDGRVWGAEALSRWTSRRLGPQAPTDFVALAEQSGLIDELTEHVLRTTTAQAARWREAGRLLTATVNVSPSALAAPHFPGLVQDCLARHGLRLTAVRLEVTESTLADGAAVAALHRLRGEGVRTVIDDFGTGYSSLARLRALPVSGIKLDRTFLTGTGDPRDLVILRSLVTLGRDLDLEVTAEGVETEETARTVAGLGAHLAQGMLYAPALPAPAFEAWLDRRTAGDRRPGGAGATVLDGLDAEVSPSGRA